MNFQTKEQIKTYTESMDRVTARNKTIMRKMNEASLKAFNSEIKERYNVDMAHESFNLEANPLFSFKKFQETCHRLVHEGKMRETAPESGFASLFRALINNNANNWYQLTETVYDQIAMIVPSSHAVEPYAPMHRGGMPRKVQPGESVKETKLIGPMDIQLMNEKYAGIASVPEEMVKWDQTAQVMERIQDIGPNMAIYQDAYQAAKFISPSGGTAWFEDVIPVSSTQPSNEGSATWPWSTSFTGGGANILSAYKRFNQQTLQNMDTLLFKQKDMAGNRLVVNCDTLFHGGALRFVADILLNSTWYPSTSAISTVRSGTEVGSGLGTTFAENVMKGLYRPVCSRYLPDTAYAIGMAHKGMVFQVASGLEVVQEVPNSGMSFSNGEWRFKSKQFWACDWIDPRFWGLCDDGSATS
jgi:hypothetical protein